MQTETTTEAANRKAIAADVAKKMMATKMLTKPHIKTAKEQAAYEY